MAKNPTKSQQKHLYEAMYAKAIKLWGMTDSDYRMSTKDFIAIEKIYFKYRKKF